MIVSSESQIRPAVRVPRQASKAARLQDISPAALLGLLTITGFLVMGYHPGLEDDAVYLAAVKHRLHPGLFPFDSQFFELQMQATVFPDWMAWFVRLSGMGVAWASLAWQFASLFAVLWACHRIARRLFHEVHAQWAAVAMVSAMFTLPVAGTALLVMDQHLHPRNLAMALIVTAVAELLEGRRWTAALLLAAALPMHPIMAAFGISFSAILTLTMREDGAAQRPALKSAAAALVPLGWAFEPANPVWRQALYFKSYMSLYRWHWYEWLGALAPLLLFWALSRLARWQGDRPLARFALAVFAYGVFQQVVAITMQAPADWVLLTSLQPMRYLEIVYLFMALVGGGLAGRYLLGRRWWRWAIFLLAANGGMAAVQCAEYSSTPHIEWPGQAPANPWLQSFAWVRQHTPTDAYFALDPHYLEAEGEDFHGFRALAERSQLADAVKDAAMVIEVPELGARWDAELGAETGWVRFQLDDFQRLKQRFGVGWVIVDLSQTDGLDCRWRNRTLAVCAIP